MLKRNRNSPRKSRPFVKLPHLEDLELDNRSLAIFVRLLWYFDDEFWRRGGLSGVASIREEALRWIAGTKRLDHADQWLSELLDHFDGSIWIPVRDGEGGLNAARERLADVLREFGASEFSLTATKSCLARIKGFIIFPKYAEFQGSSLQTRPDTDEDTHADAHTHADQHPNADHDSAPRVHGQSRSPVEAVSGGLDSGSQRGQPEPRGFDGQGVHVVSWLRRIGADPRHSKSPSGEMHV